MKTVTIFVTFFFMPLANAQQLSGVCSDANASVTVNLKFNEITLRSHEGKQEVLTNGSGLTFAVGDQSIIFDGRVNGIGIVDFTSNIDIAYNLDTVSIDPSVKKAHSFIGNRVSRRLICRYVARGGADGLAN